MSPQRKQNGHILLPRHCNILIDLTAILGYYKINILFHARSLAKIQHRMQ